MSVLPKHAVRVLHCPTNIAGQMWEYVQGLRALGIEATALTFAPHPFGYQDDICLNLHVESSIWRRRVKLVKNFVNVLRRYDVIHFHFGETLLPHYLDLPILKLLGKKMVMNYWGSDVRLRDVAIRNNPFYNASNIHLGNDDEKVRRMKQVSRYVEVAIVADYELFSYIAPFFRKVVIIPQSIDISRFKPVFPDPKNSNPLIVHASSRKDVKGTLYVEEAIARLKKKYCFDFLCLHQAKNEEVIEAFKKANIVVDQLLLGAYGIASVEAMALGKPVICYIRDDLIGKYPEDLPIINANPHTIENVLETLLVDPKLRYEMGMRSRAFVERYHDSKVVAKKLLALYDSL
jgi:glycosyltransferase involved in cell wall biosynthesis